MVPQRNLLSIAMLLFLVIVLITSMILLIVSSSKKSKIESEIASKYEVINRFVKTSKMPMTEKSTSLLTEEANRLRDIYGRFKLALASSLNEEVPEEELEPLHFKERLIQTQKRLREDARGRNLSLPDSLGFTKYETELSDPSEIADLIKRLKVLEELTHAMASSDIDILDEINFANRYAEENALPLLDTARREYADISLIIPVSLKVGCSITKLIDFLYKIRSSPFIFIIDDLDIEKAQLGRLKVNLSIRAIGLN